MNLQKQNEYINLMCEKIGIDVDKAKIIVIDDVTDGNTPRFCRKIRMTFLVDFKIGEGKEDE